MMEWRRDRSVGKHDQTVSLRPLLGETIPGDLTGGSLERDGCPPAGTFLGGVLSSSVVEAPEPEWWPECFAPAHTG